MGTDEAQRYRRQLKLDKSEESMPGRESIQGVTSGHRLPALMLKGSETDTAFADSIATPWYQSSTPHALYTEQ